MNVLFCFMTAIAISFPGMCFSLIYRKQVTPEWIEFWKHERKPGRINMLSSCPWRYIRNMTSGSDCGNVFVELHPLAENNCIDLEQSSERRRIHSTGKCTALRSKCDCNKVIGYTCAHTIDIPAGPTDKRNSEDKCNVTEIKDGEDAIKVIKICEDKNETESINGSSTGSTTANHKTENYEQNTEKPKYTKKQENDVLVPPFLKGGIPPFLRRNNFQMGPPSYLQGLNPQIGLPPLLRPSQFNMNYESVNVNDRNTNKNRTDTFLEPRLNKDMDGA